MGAFGIDVKITKNKENESAGIGHLFSISPYPILKVGKNGAVVYANEACFPLLEIWGINEGEKLPSKILFFVRKAILGKRVKEIEVKRGDKEYLLTLKSSGNGYAYIYGLELSSPKLKEKLLHIEKIKPGAFREPGKIVPPSSDLHTLMNQVAEMIASALQVESCRILKISHEKTDFLKNYPEWNEGQEVDKNDLNSQLNESSISETKFQCPKPEFDEETCNGKYFQEIGSNEQALFMSHEFAGGINVFAKRNGKTFAVIELQKVKCTEFALENVCFLRYVLSLVIRLIECQEIDRKLRDRIHFFETLLNSVPYPTYFRDISCGTEDYNEFFIDGLEDFSKENPVGNPIIEIDKVIRKKFTAPSKKTGEEISKDAGGLMAAMQDISSLKESEETLKIALEVQKVLWTVINNSPAVVFLWRNEKNWPTEFVSENVSQLGYTVEDFISGKFLYGDIIHREDVDRVREELDYCIKTGHGDFRTEYRIYTKAGELRWVDERTFIQWNKTGKASYFQGLVIDITERKFAEEAVKQAELLRKKEINHRIKNNLQIVSSLLDLQAEKFSDKKVIEAFRESENRILSMSLIHEELYESGKLDSLDFSSYLHKLIADLLRLYKTEKCKVQVNFDVCSVFLGVDTAVSLGIIINELFTNSLKYAFPAGSCGEIHIALFREKDKERKDGNELSSEIFSAINPDFKSSLPESRTYEPLTLIFADNGEGFPEEIDFRNPETLGLQLVNALVEQIEGSINLERGKGTRFIIKFKGEIQDSNEKVVS